MQECFTIDLHEKISEILPLVLRPGRYAGNEINSIVKSAGSVDVRFALAFPDVYEIGMSHPGFEILYHVLNRRTKIAAERVYAPWVDMEDLMRKRRIPLFSLETRTAVRDFDILGFTLQYELQYTNILNMLDLAGIPLDSSARTEEDPLVIAGGPCAFNPEPLAPFLDAVLVGDGEKAAVEIAEAVAEAGRNSLGRQDTLRLLAGIDGVYVPSLYRERGGSLKPADEAAPAVVKARIEPVLEESSYPEAPLVSLIEITHDRFSLEVMRGCTRGCRFCNAGIIYRPLRARSAAALTAHCRQVIAGTGFDEISLLSLSTSDYPELSGLLGRLQNWTRDKGISVSFPSLRAETFTEELAQFARDFRKSGLTLAPEAGTQRLRNVINKNNTEEELLESVRIAFENGWKRVKLYFMTGLPTETDEDILGIAGLVNKTAALARRYKKGEISVSISPFSPKPHTPFQWEPQDPPQELNRKAEILRRHISRKGIKLNWRDPEISRLEAVMGRGDRRMAEVIRAAWRKGARFDAWSEHFSAARWHAAFEECGTDIDACTAAYDPQDPLPWDHINKGVTKAFLLAERGKAFSEHVSPDCAGGTCLACGLMDQPACKAVQKRKPGNKPAAEPLPAEKDAVWGRGKKRISEAENVRKVRICYRKGGQISMTSHLDLVRIFVRAFRRANIDLVFSQGFHPHPKVSPGPPLSLGYTSLAEYIDIEFSGPLPEHFITAVNARLPRDLTVTEYAWIFARTPSLNACINLQDYRIDLSEETDYQALKNQIADFLSRNRFVCTRHKKGRDVQVDIRQYVQSMELGTGTLDLRLRTGPAGTARVSEVLSAVFDGQKHADDIMRITRTAQLIAAHGQLKTPLEIL